MQTIQAVEYESDERCGKHYSGRLLLDSDVDTVVNETAMVLKPDGNVLLVLLKGVIPSGMVEQSYPAFLRASRMLSVSNRGMATGRVRFTEPIDHLFAPAKTGITEKTRLRPIKEDGTFSKTNYSIHSERVQRLLEQNNITMEVQMSSGEWVSAKSAGYLRQQNGVVGYLDKQARFPYCRLTAFNLNHPDYYQDILPYARRVDEIFAAYLPERYAAQREVVAATSPEFYMHGTVFTTITVNFNFVTAVHKDAGDLQQGFGVMSVIRRGPYSGGYTSFPRYRLGANMETGDVLLSDVHEWHGNTPIVAPGLFERIATVFYYREKMQECGTPEANLQRAKRTRGKAKLKDWQ
jgi:hypothetical protein